jgi:glutathione peroxidase
MLAIMALVAAPSLFAAPPQDCPATLDFHKRPLAGEQPVHLCEEYAGRVVLMVNTASKCGFTPQFEGLEALYDRYREQGLVVLGFPSNDFGNQDPGTEQQIQEFCRLTYGVQFPMFEKTHAARSTADPLYRLLGELSGEWPQWNFHKYLIGRDGELIGSFASQVRPDDARLVGAIEAQL